MMCFPTLRCSLAIVLIYLSFAEARNQYTLKNNGYEGLLVAIHEDVNENDQLIARIQEIFTESSKTLFRATKNRIFFRNITILVPSTWQKKPEYKKAKQESFDTANIVIDKGSGEPGVVLTDNPYVKRSRDCGEEGEFMHLTPTYVLDKTRSLRYWGPYGKLIVHEFGHLRWGLLDEYPTDGYGHFYKSDGVVLPSRCAENLRGSHFNWKTSRACAHNETTGLPEDDCRFFPDTTQTSTSASIMYVQYPDGIDDFCESNRWNSATLHNSEVPNMHNTFCEGQSAWDVMKKHEDFKGDQSVPQELLDTTPVFHIVQKSEESEKTRICLVLDVSGSMNGEPLKKMRQATSSFILGSLESFSKIALVSFSLKATTLQDLVEVTSQSDRDMLISKLPSGVGGQTSIGAGIQRAIEIFKAASKEEEDVAGSQIILLTDGKENTAPLIKDVEPNATRLGIVINSIAYGQKADMKITALSSNTGGRSMYASTNSMSTGIQDALNSLAAGSTKEAKITVTSETLTITSNGVGASGTFHIDGTIGNGTYVAFSYSSAIEVQLTTPDGTVHNKDSKYYKDQQAFNLLTIHLPGVAKPGKYMYKVESNKAQYVVVVVTSRTSSPNAEPIKVASFLQSGSVKFSDKTVLQVYADVSQGYKAVTGAKVEADVERPDGVNKIIPLDDNGAGCDMRKQDGQYCGYFIAEDFKGNGRYSVKIKVSTNDGESAQVTNIKRFPSPPIISKDTVEDLYKVQSSSNSVGAFQRVDTAGEITVSGFPLDSSYVVPDNIPPARITDLRVYLVEDTVTLMWTAPGDDMTRGKASKYEIRMVQNYTVLRSKQFEAKQLISQDQLLSGKLLEPLESSRLEEFVYKIPNLDKSASYYMSVRASDEIGNIGALSNIAVTSYAPPINGDNSVGIAIGVTLAILLLIGIIIGVIVFLKCKPKITQTSPVKDPENPAQDKTVTQKTEVDVVKETTKSEPITSPETKKSKASIGVNGTNRKPNTVVLPPLNVPGGKGKKYSQHGVNGKSSNVVKKTHTSAKTKTPNVSTKKEAKSNISKNGVAPSAGKKSGSSSVKSTTLNSASQSAKDGNNQMGKTQMPKKK